MHIVTHKCQSRTQSCPVPSPNFTKHLGNPGSCQGSSHMTTLCSDTFKTPLLKLIFNFDKNICLSFFQYHCTYYNRTRRSKRYRSPIIQGPVL